MFIYCTVSLFYSYNNIGFVWRRDVSIYGTAEILWPDWCDKYFQAYFVVVGYQGLLWPKATIFGSHREIIHVLRPLQFVLVKCHNILKIKKTEQSNHRKCKEGAPFTSPRMKHEVIVETI